MSGKDEQPVGLLFDCGCENFEYWAMMETGNKCLGWLNNEKHPRIVSGKYAFGDSDAVGRVNLKTGMSMTLEEFRRKIKFIKCRDCQKLIKPDNPKFKILISYLRKHWNNRTWR